MNVHRVLFVLVLLLLISFPVYSQSRGVDIKPIDRQTPTPSVIQEGTTWVMNHIWLIIIFLAIGGGIFLILFIWKKTVAKVDPFYENWKKTKQLCKLNKRWSVKDVYRVSGSSGLKWLGHYEGDCTLEDGTINVMWSNWKWGFFGKAIRWVFFPLRPLLKLVMKEYHIVKAPYGEREVTKIEKIDRTTTDKDGNTIQEKIPKIEYGEMLNYIIFDNSGNCLVKSKSLSKTKHFYCPVTMNERGEVIDTRYKTFQKEYGGAIVEGLYNLTVDFANIMRERISVEPKVRYIQKTEGTEVSGKE